MVQLLEGYVLFTAKCMPPLFFLLLISPLSHQAANRPSFFVSDGLHPSREQNEE